ncbi:MAG: hypothetical protein COA94_01710 [Rickettsiales bacterium]|nr:MAG: hypothetical protein COA94_01710 [Rickettsiales bacterium]
MKNNTNLHAILWLKTGITALAIAGLYSIILVLLRTPGLNQLFTDKSIFKSALVIHVNLSVLVWLLAITCIIWSISKVRSGFESLFTYIAIAGMALMALSPLYPESVPIMNNYVPMLENIFFAIGLGLFGTAILCFAIQTILTSFMGDAFSDYGERIIAITKITSAMMYVAVWICFILSFIGVSALSEIVPLDIEFFYEMLFWSGGHLLQFIYTQILMIVLLILAEGWRGGRIGSHAEYELILVLNFVLSLAVFLGHAYYDIADGLFKEFFTRHMIYSGGVAPVIFIAMLIAEIVQKRTPNVPTFIPAAFVSSVLLFLSGGAIGAVISGVNVTIPAHYHGSIVGISVAFMGLSYMLCFQKNVAGSLTEKGGVISFIIPNSRSDNTKSQRSASWQIYTVTIGQILHIGGLALAGGYGVMRKTPGEEIALSAKVYMGMVGAGGLLAIIGGLMFVYICARKLFYRE